MKGVKTGMIKRGLTLSVFRGNCWGMKKDLRLEYEALESGWKAAAERRWKEEGCLEAADAYRKMLRLHGVEVEDAWKQAIERFPPLDFVKVSKSVV